jgi:hypothetical protein
LAAASPDNVVADAVPEGVSPAPLVDVGLEELVVLELALGRVLEGVAPPPPDEQAVRPRAAATASGTTLRVVRRDEGM